MSDSIDVDRVVTRIEWLARAGARLTIDNAQSSDTWIDAAPGIQALFETLEDLAADLYQRLEAIERTRRKAA